MNELSYNYILFFSLLVFNGDFGLYDFYVFLISNNYGDNYFISFESFEFSRDIINEFFLDGFLDFS